MGTPQEMIDEERNYLESIQELQEANDRIRALEIKLANKEFINSQLQKQIKELLNENKHNK